MTFCCQYAVEETYYLDLLERLQLNSIMQNHRNYQFEVTCYETFEDQIKELEKMFMVNNNIQSNQNSSLTNFMIHSVVSFKETYASQNENDLTNNVQYHMIFDDSIIRNENQTAIQSIQINEALQQIILQASLVSNLPFKVVKGQGVQFDSGDFSFIIAQYKKNQKVYLYLKLFYKPFQNLSQEQIKNRFTSIYKSLMVCTFNLKEMSTENQSKILDCMKIQSEDNNCAKWSVEYILQIFS